jgi:hypothetical protein
METDLVSKMLFSFQNWTIHKVQTPRISTITAADTTSLTFSVWSFKFHKAGELFKLNAHCRTVFFLSDERKYI